jgi:HTH-type transcriptional regulator/antitoxin HigA
MLKPIKTEDQYSKALARVYELMQTDVLENSIESDELEVLSILVKEYETDHYPIPSPNPLEAIKFRIL